MAQQVAASPARLTPRYTNPASRDERLRGKELDFIAPPRRGFPGIIGAVGGMCVFVGGQTSSSLRCTRRGSDLISSLVNTCGSLFM